MGINTDLFDLTGQVTLLTGASKGMGKSATPGGTPSMSGGAPMSSMPQPRPTDASAGMRRMGGCRDFPPARALENDENYPTEARHKRLV